MERDSSYDTGKLATIQPKTWRNIRSASESIRSIAAETTNGKFQDSGVRPDDQTSSTEFLTMLPDELWYEILDQVYPSRDGIAATASAFTSWGHAIGVLARDAMQRARKIQKYRSQLRLVCKRLEPVALAVLFQDIVLPYHHTELELLFQTAQSTQRRLSSPGHLTQRLMTRLCFPNGTVYDQKLDRIHNIFPNINTLIIDDNFSEKVVNFNLDWIRGVKHLCWYPPPLNYDQFSQIMAQNPGLKSFVLSSQSATLHSWPEHTAWGAIQQLYLGYPPHTSFLASLPLNLDRLAFTFGTSLALDLSKLRTRMLTSLEVHWSTSRERPLAMDDVLSLLYTCPRLEVFTTSTCYSFVAPKREYEAHSSLHTLCITDAIGQVHATLRQWGIVHSRSGYPHFSRVIFLQRPNYMREVTDSAARFLREERDIPVEFIFREL